MSRRSYWPRDLEDRLVEASQQFPVLLLTGPRQVGKTTLLQHLCGRDRSYVTLDDPIRRELAEKVPGNATITSREPTNPDPAPIALQGGRTIPVLG